MPDDLTTTEAAAALGIQANSVKRLCQRGTLKAEKRGRDWFISRDEIERYKNSSRKRGPKFKKDRPNVATSVAGDERRGTLPQHTAEP